MGQGIFATRDIPMSEIIFAERPLLVAPHSLVPKKDIGDGRTAGHDTMDRGKSGLWLTVADGNGNTYLQITCTESNLISSRHGSNMDFELGAQYGGLYEDRRI